MNILLHLSLRSRLVVFGIALALVPLLVLSGLIWRQNHLVSQTAEEGSQRLSFYLDQSAAQVRSMCEAYQLSLEQDVRKSLRVLADKAKSYGDFGLSADSRLDWKALDQMSGAEVNLSLPELTLGGRGFGQVAAVAEPSFLVDEVQKIAGGTSTVFQRMNERGDMLRVATNVVAADGRRAIGTYIPVTEPGGQPNPVLAAVLRGEGYQGKAFVVNQWYITAYQPIFDDRKEVIGMLYCGTPVNESTESLRRAIMSTRIGKSGYIFVLHAQGPNRGSYVISQDGLRDGENLWESRDENGILFIQEICRQALALPPGAVGEQRYLWKNPGESEARTKLTRFVYFQPWDWVVGAGCPEEELNETATHILQLEQESERWTWGLAGTVLLAALALSLWAAASLARPLQKISGLLGAGSEDLVTSATQFSAASQSLAEGASEQAASLEETSAALEELSGMTQRNVEAAQMAKDLAGETRTAVEAGNVNMEKLQNAMVAIEQSSGQVAGIIKTIDEIAFQTNILALNAAVEAARAGEAGAGFAVVADEVRTLAQRCAQAARETVDQIEDSIAKSAAGSQVSAEVGRALAKIMGSVLEMDRLVADIANASVEQSQGIRQINHAVLEVDGVTQRSAASAEESASASESLRLQAESLRGAAAELQTLLRGGGLAAAHPAPPPGVMVPPAPKPPSPPLRPAPSTLHFPGPARATAAETAPRSTPRPAEQPVDRLAVGPRVK